MDNKALITIRCCWRRRMPGRQLPQHWEAMFLVFCTHQCYMLFLQLKCAWNVGKHYRSCLQWKQKEWWCCRQFTTLAILWSTPSSEMYKLLSIGDWTQPFLDLVRALVCLRSTIWYECSYATITYVKWNSSWRCVTNVVLRRALWI